MVSRVRVKEYRPSEYPSIIFRNKLDDHRENSTHPIVFSPYGNALHFRNLFVLNKMRWAGRSCTAIDLLTNWNVTFR